MIQMWKIYEKKKSNEQVYMFNILLAMKINAI
jgi:hypothetical protein